jgi:hypothetical protein
MTWCPLGVHICGINEVSAIIKVVTQDAFGVFDIGAKPKDIATKTEGMNL